jgi:two-component system sensor histidine kinase KdpD
MTSVTLLERSEARAGSPWPAQVPRSTTPSEADTEVPTGDRLVLALAGRRCARGPAPGRRLRAAQAALVVDHLRLSRAAAEAGHLAEANKVRTASSPRSATTSGTPLARRQGRRLRAC